MNSKNSITAILIVLTSAVFSFNLHASASRISGGSDLRVITSTKSFVVVEYRPLLTDSTTLLLENESFLRLGILNGISDDSLSSGSPLIQYRSVSLGVPSEYGNTLEVLETEYKDINAKLAPKPETRLKNNMAEYTFQIAESYFSPLKKKDLVSFGGFGLFRDMPVQSIRVRPIDFDPAASKVRLYTKVVFRLNYSSQSQRSVTSPRALKDELLEGSVLNYSEARNWAIRSPLNKLSKSKFNSVLSQGRWFRFEAPEEGIYKLTPAILNSLGINPQTVDPKTIKIYNNGGRMLDESIVKPRPIDLTENATYLFKATDDGKFNEGDYILFYGRGINFWQYDSLQRKILRQYHLYSKSNYYFLTFGGSQARRIQEKPNITDPLAVARTTTQAFQSWEVDKAKLMNSGRLYMGDDYTETQRTRTYLTDLFGVVPNTKVTYRFDFVNRAEADAGLRIDENSTTIFNSTIYGVGIDNLENAEAYRGINYVGSATYSGTYPDNRSVLKFTYGPNSSPAIGYMNWFEINYTKQLVASADQLMFFSPDTNAAIEYRLSGFSTSDFRVFDITDYSNMKIVSGAKISGGDCIFQAAEALKKVSKYLAVGSNTYKSPVNFAELTNSNLHGMAEEGKFIIITHKNFLEQAKRLKAHKESLPNKVSTVVVDVQDIFNEFSSGQTDVSAIRDFIKYAYDNWTIRPEYVLLFGDGDYDYKNILGKNQNFVIPYESLDSYHAIYSYCSDDFYAYVSGDDQIVDLGLGRIDVTSLSEAQAAVDKIIKYETSSDIGTWRNLITMIADDAFTSSGNEGTYHNEQSEAISAIIPQSFDQQKIYEAQYPTVQTSAGRRKPAVNKAIIDAINNGTLIINWIGHGNPDVWAHEYVFEKGTTIPQLVNNKYCFLTAATCDFGRYDDPDEQSSTELMLLKPDGGIIGAFTAARTVYALDNYELAKIWYSNLLIKDSTGFIRPLGKSYMLTKMVRNSQNDLKYHLFGDPTLRLLEPTIPVSVDSINGRPANVVSQVRALSKLKIAGSVKNADNSVNGAFSGEGIITVYDSDRRVAVPDLNGMEISLQGGIIYKGRVGVSSGRFSTEFTVPKDISYEDKSGKIEAYVYTSNADGLGFSKSIIVGGTDTLNQNDGKGPIIDIAFDDTTGVNSLLVKPSFDLYVKLKDDTGLNTTGTGIGHKTEGILNGNENSPIDFSNYFLGALNAGGRSGVIKYHFDQLDAGTYTIKVRAWDVFNNRSESEKSFTVVSQEGLVVRDVLNYPNPFRDNTTFTLQHNLNEPVNVIVKVFTVAGRLIRSLEADALTDRFVKLDWDGRDQNGNMIANGTYLYKVIVRTTSESYSQEVLGKLAIVR